MKLEIIFSDGHFYVGQIRQATYVKDEQALHIVTTNEVEDAISTEFMTSLKIDGVDYTFRIKS